MSSFIYYRCKIIWTSHYTMLCWESSSALSTSQSRNNARYRIVNYFSIKLSIKNSLYAQLSSLHKLKIRYAIVFNKDLIKLKLRVFFSCAFWWIFSVIIIVNNDEIVMIIHDWIVSKEIHLMIYIDESDINDEVDV